MAVECLEQRVLLAAVITVTNVDALGIDADGDGVADPGDQIHYTVTVQNTGDASATGLTFQEIINDPNLTLLPGSINVSPLAINDTFTAVANTQLVVGNATPLGGPAAIVAGNVLANDIEFLGDSYTISTFDSTSAQGGTVSLVTSGVNAGSFTYLPGAGDTGTDTFTYTIRDDGIDGIAGNADDLISVGTVTITIGTQKVWYVDNSSDAVGDGTSTNPFDSLADVTGGAGPDAAGDIIYVHTGSGNYGGGITLQTNQTLWGANETLIVGGFTLQAAGTDPVIENAAGNGVTLDTGNTLKGLTIGNTTTGDIVGTAVGNLTISNVISNGTGPIITVSTSGALNVVLDSASTSSATTGISLTGVTGNFTSSAGAISGVTGTDVLISGGTATVNIANSITTNTGGSIEVTGRGAGSNTVAFSGALSISGGTGISVHDNTAGTVAFSNASKSINTNAVAGVNLVNNTGATINFTGGGLDIDTTSGTGFNATGGGTVNVTGTNNSLFANGSGTALNVANTTIGASGLTFQSIAAGTGVNSAGAGIILDTTGTLGGLTVTGVGSTAGSGGTIQRKTGTDGTSSGVGIFLNSTNNVSLANMQLNDFSNFGIKGTTVNGFSMTNTVINATGAATNGDVQGEGGTGEGSVRFVNLVGTVTVTDSTITHGVYDNFGVFNTNTSTTLNFTSSNNTFATSTNLNTGNDAVRMEFNDTVAGGSQTTANIVFNNDNDFTSSRGDLIDIIGQTSIVAGTAANAAIVDVQILGNDFSNNHAGIASGGGGAIVHGNGNVTFNIDNNDFQDARGRALNISKGATAGIFSGTINNNRIGVTGVGFSGSDEASGIYVDGGGAGSMVVNITNNTVRRTNEAGIFVVANNQTISGNNSTLTATITGNLVAEPENFSFAGLWVDIGTGINTDTSVAILNIGGSTSLPLGNDFSTGDPSNFGDISLSVQASSVMRFVGYGGADNDDDAIRLYLRNRNINGGSTAISLSHGGTMTSNPLLFAPTIENPPPAEEPADLIEPETPTETAPDDETTGETPPEIVDETDTEPPEIVDDGVLSQEELDFLVAAAIARWEATGLTAEQIAILHSVTFTVEELPGWILGQSASGVVIIDANAAGNSWFIDSTPYDDSEYSGTGTVLYATANGGAAGRVDALTTIMHELGHQLGVDDSYDAADSSNLMYGWIQQGVRRLPAAGQADGADPLNHEQDGPAFLFGSMNIGTLPAGYSITIVYDATVDSMTNGVAPKVTSQVRIIGDGGINVLSDDPAIAGAANPTETQLDGITLGNLVWGDTDANGVFNGLETGINGVTVNLYVDVNTNGVLDVGDGAAIATTSTAGGGLYSFSVLPGDYLVEIAAVNFQSGGALEGMLSTGGSAIDPDNNTNNDDNGVNNLNPAVNGISSQAITLNYNTEPTADGTGQFDINNTLDFGFVASVPPVLAVPGNITYTEDDPATAIAAGLTVVDADSATLAGATITITNFVAGQDVLAFTNDGLTMGNIAVVTNVGGVLTLTSAGATATTAQWQAALRAVTYDNTSHTPNTTQRSVEFVVDDGTAPSNTLTSTINITATNDVPQLAVPGNITYTENDPATAIAAAITVADLDNATLASATITITNFVAGQDVLAFTNDGLTMGNIAIVTNVGGVLTLTSAGATATTAQWQAALRAVTYENTSHTPNTTQRSVEFVANDGTDPGNTLTSTIDITATNDVPQLAVPGNITYMEDDPATAIAAGITVADLDNATLASATITITNFVAGQDVLAFTNDGLTMGNISIVTNVGGVLTLTSAGATATTAQWQAALRAVTYENTSEDPNTTQRSVEFVANDGTDPGNTLTSTINITATNDAPVLANIEPESLLYPPNAPAVVITSTLTLADLDNANMTGATVQITGNHLPGDVLGFVNTPNITGNYNAGTGILTLTGTDTAANYQAALRSVTYASSSQNAAARTVSFQVNDGTDPSNFQARTIGGYAQLNGGTVNVYGTPQGDVITVTDSGPLEFIVNGVSSQFESVQVTAINIFGFNGNDTILINSLTSGKTLQVLGGGGNDTLRVDSSVTSGVQLNGGDGNDLLVGGSGNDVLIGGIGNDWLDGGDGSDSLTGGIGNDVYAFSGAAGNQTDTVVELAGEGIDTLNFAAMTTAVTVNLTSDTSLATMSQRIVKVGLAGQSANFENVFGGSASDFITGNAANNDLYGNGNNDTLNGVDGSDYLDGGAGNDLLKGGNQDDVLIGGLGGDYLMGEAGNDRLNGGDGSNALAGGAGNDTYVFNPATINQIDTVVELVGEGIDTLNFAALATAVNVNLTSDSSLATMAQRIVKVASPGQSAHFENATGGSGNDQITGNSANNLLIGNGGNDTIIGIDGSDILLGGQGNDTLRGLSGRNILIGGTGGDLLQGGTGGDLLLSGSSTFETDPAILQALLAEWTSLGSYQSRVDHLLGNTGGGANTTFTLNSSTVTNDANADYLTGNAGQDWFLANSLQDVITDKAVDEIFTHIDTWI